MVACRRVRCDRKRVAHAGRLRSFLLVFLQSLSTLTVDLRLACQAGSSGTAASPIGNAAEQRLWQFALILGGIFGHFQGVKPMFASQPKVCPTPAAESNPPSQQQAQDKAAKPGYSSVEWSVLVDQIKAGEDAGMEHLYKLFSRGIRYYLCRQLGPQELEDKVHDTF